MRFLRLLSALTALFALAIMLAIHTTAQQGGGADRAGGGPAAKPLIMTLPAFPDGGEVPIKFTAAGEQVSPEIDWTNVPQGTVTLVLSMHDMENIRMRTTTDQVHWLVWNIPASATGLPEAVPQGSQLQNGAYQISVSGPVYRAPGHNANPIRHHYTFELFAIDTKLDVQPSTDAFQTRDNVMKAIQGHILGKAVFVGLFKPPAKAAN